MLVTYEHIEKYSVSSCLYIIIFMYNLHKNNYRFRIFVRIKNSEKLRVLHESLFISTLSKFNILFVVNC